MRHCQVRWHLADWEFAKLQCSQIEQPGGHHGLNYRPESNLSSGRVGLHGLDETDLHLDIEMKQN
jgi:hypothetical protein